MVAVACSFGVAIFQTVSLGALVPFFDTLFKGDRSRTLGRLAETFGETGRRLLAWLEPILLSDTLRALILLSLVLVVFVLWKGVAQFFQEYATGVLAHGTARDLGDDLYGGLLSQPHRFVESEGGASLASRFAVDLDQIAQGVKALFSKALLEPLKGTGAILLIIALQPTLAVVSLVAFPILALLFLAIGRRVKRTARRVLDSRATLLGLIQEGLRALRVVKAFGAERYEHARFKAENDGLYRKNLGIIAQDAMISPVMEFLGTLAVAACTVVGGGFVVRGEMTPGEFITFYIGLVAVYDPIRRFGNTFNRIQACGAAAERVFEILDLPPAEPDDASSIEVGALEEAIVFEDVHFGYGAGREVLSGVSFRVERGERVGLVGLSGAGTSTLVSLLLGFEKPDRGRLLVDGVPLGRVKLGSWRAQIGLVTQDVHLFNDTVLRNVAYGSEAPDRERVEAACRAAHAHAFVEGLSDGYDSVIGENGLTLSGGQRQRLALARALYRDPSVLVLDEATSAVDREHDARILESLVVEGRRRTILVIAHRPSTLLGCDRVLTLEEGRIVAAEKQLLGGRAF